MNNKRVLIAMSGGVDSSAAAALLQAQGYTCGGAMLRLYRDPEVDRLSAQNAADAQAVAERLGMEFHLLDETERFCWIGRWSWATTILPRDTTHG